MIARSECNLDFFIVGLVSMIVAQAHQTIVHQNVVVLGLRGSILLLRVSPALLEFVLRGVRMQASEREPGPSFGNNFEIRQLITPIFRRPMDSEREPSQIRMFRRMSLG
jgi:hypothetical protein